MGRRRSLPSLPARRKRDVAGDERGCDRQEEAAAEAIGGRRTRGSGSGNEKGDAVSDLFRVECKTTGKRSLSVKADWLEKIAAEAAHAPKPRLPVLNIGFDGGLEGTEQDWYAVPAGVFRALAMTADALARNEVEEAREWLQTLAP